MHAFMLRVQTYKEVTERRYMENTGATIIIYNLFIVHHDPKFKSFKNCVLGSARKKLI